MYVSSSSFIPPATTTFVSFISSQSMETLSTSVSSTLRIHQTLKNHNHQIPPPQQQHHHYFNSSSSSIPKPNTSLLTSKTAVHLTPHKSPFVASKPLKQSSKNPQPLFHKNAASGYAVALLETARRHEALEAVARDVKKMSKWMMQLCSSVEMRDIGETILKGILEHGKLHKHLVKLVRLLVEKNKVGIVGQVLMEFQRFYGELSVSGGANDNDDSNDDNDQVVLIPCGMRLDVNQVVGIAKRVQKISGAEKVKVRQVVQQKFTSFAVV